MISFVFPGAGIATNAECLLDDYQDTAKAAKVDWSLWEMRCDKDCKCLSLSISAYGWLIVSGH